MSKEQFIRVGKILDGNYKGNLHVQRENKHEHIFSKKLYCGQCGKMLFAALDSPRKDGYRPSRYTCSTNETRAKGHNCNSFISDIDLLPFMLNYVSNLIRLQDKITPKHTLRDIERLLLRGNPFIDILGIERQALQTTREMFLQGFKKLSYSYASKGNDQYSTLDIQQLKKSKSKYETALERLEDLYLFGEEAMGQKEYVFKKNKLFSSLEAIDEEINSLYQSSSSSESDVDNSWMEEAKEFLLTQENIS
ncbi:zinc ribbon domain-containing protein [Oceanobacillus sp. FSL W7-1281]|uniref:zinc ribbon domain-containing protein n=1 Tax=Oceanobacillus sp. FSL W7-1281 TaxID=2921698 RepID=UPI0030D86D7F